MVTYLQAGPPQSAAGDWPSRSSLTALEWAGKHRPKLLRDRKGDTYSYGLFRIHSILFRSFLTARSRSIIGVLYHHLAHPARPDVASVSPHSFHFSSTQFATKPLSHTAANKTKVFTSENWVPGTNCLLVLGRSWRISPSLLFHIAHTQALECVA